MYRFPRINVTNIPLIGPQGGWTCQNIVRTEHPTSLPQGTDPSYIRANHSNGDFMLLIMMGLSCAIPFGRHTMW